MRLYSFWNWYTRYTAMLRVTCKIQFWQNSGQNALFITYAYIAIPSVATGAKWE